MNISLLQFSGTPSPCWCWWLSGAMHWDTLQNLGNREFDQHFIDHKCNSLKVRFHKIHIPDSSQQLLTSPDNFPTSPDKLPTSPDKSWQVPTSPNKPQQAPTTLSKVLLASACHMMSNNWLCQCWWWCWSAPLHMFLHGHSSMFLAISQTHGHAHRQKGFTKWHSWQVLTNSQHVLTSPNNSR